MALISIRFHKMKKFILAFFLIACFACQPKEEVDLILTNGKIYTVDNAFNEASAFAIEDGKFLAVGSNQEIQAKYQSSNVIDAGGDPVYPGLIDAHCHFVRYGLGLTNVDLVGTQSFNEIIEKVKNHREAYPDEAWILGRGWDQNDWEDKSFPTRAELDALFPETPVLLNRIDGHAALVNKAALDLAGITKDTKVNGGAIRIENGEVTGVLVDNAIDLVSDNIPEPSRESTIRSLISAQENCFAVGLTTVDDAGLEKSMIDLIDSLNKSGTLKIRIYAMLSPSESNKEYYYQNGPYKTDYLNVRSFKIYADGALGSRGACLLQPYSDDPGNNGFLLNTVAFYEDMAQEMNQYGFQMNTHCIGDSSNRLILDIYGNVLGGSNDKRWRIEHAQVISPSDFQKFDDYDVIPSVQTTHATSDMYWVEDRLGPERVKGAYAFKELNQKQSIAIGSDFPVEDINPLLGFYAATARQDAEGYPDGGFQIENALSRKEALVGMTLGAAFSNFEEQEKGSIEPGKLADFVILDKDIMTIPLEEILSTKVKSTYSGGEKVY